MKRFIDPCATLLLLLGSSSCMSPKLLMAEPISKRPNIVVILSDDMGYSDLGCFGGEIKTPTLDGLSHNGLRFTQFYNTARCCPTRAALLTGMYPHEAGLGHMTGHQHDGLPGYSGNLRSNCATLAEALRPAGYQAYHLGKWHVSNNVHPQGPRHTWPRARGFHRSYGTIAGAGNFFDPASLVRDDLPITIHTDPEKYPADDYYYTDALSDEAARFIREHHHTYANTDTPFVIYIAFTAAHWPMHAKDRDIAAVKGRYDAGYEAISQKRLQNLEHLGIINSDFVPAPLTKKWAAVKNRAWEAACMEVYAAMIESMDRGIGRVVHALKETEVFDNTLVMYCQDNGACAEDIGRKTNDSRQTAPSLPIIADDTLLTHVHAKQTRDGWPILGGSAVMPGPRDTFIAYGEGWAGVSNTPLQRFKHWVHEGGISTPLIVHWPRGIPESRRGTTVDVPAHVIDLVPTCMAVAGAKHPSESDEVSWKKPSGISLLPTFATGTCDRVEPIYFEHEGNRAVRDGDWKLVAAGPASDWELYNIAKDRGETKDLAAVNGDRVKNMSQAWESWAHKSGAKPWPWKDTKGAPKSKNTSINRASESPSVFNFVRQSEKNKKIKGDSAAISKSRPKDISIEPTIADVAYGPHPKQVLHVWKAVGDTPRPLVFFVHGGGWTGGDRSSVSGVLRRTLDAGISVVSVEYRFISEAQADGIQPPVKAPLFDAARALQFVRSNAKAWNIDPVRIGASGGSAGACTSLWLAFHDDLADPASLDPVSRESTRLFCVAVNGAQTSLDPKQMTEWIPNSRYGGHAFGFLKNPKERDSQFAEFLAARESILPWINEYSPYALVSQDDPPVYLFYTSPPNMGKEEKDPTHSANFGVKLAERLKEVDVPCELVYPGSMIVTHQTTVDYLIKTLHVPAASHKKE